MPNSIDEVLKEIPLLGPFEIIDSLETADLGALVTALEQPEHQPALAKLMYYQRYFEVWNHRFGKALTQASIKISNEHKSSDKGHIPLALRDHENHQYLIDNIRSLQAIQGCLGECYEHCGVDAVKGVRDGMSTKQVLYFIERSQNPPQIYWANDPLLLAKKLDFKKIISAMIDKYNHVWIITSIPPGTEELYKEMVELAANHPKHLPRVIVSLSQDNAERLYKKGILGIPDCEDILRYRFDVQPHEVRERHQDTWLNVGINHYMDATEEDTAIYGTGSVMTLYGILNAVRVQPSRDNPQGLMIVPFCGFDEINPQVGEPVLPYLKNCLVRGFSNYTFTLLTQKQNIDVTITSEGIIDYVSIRKI